MSLIADALKAADRERGGRPARDRDARRVLGGAAGAARWVGGAGLPRHLLLPLAVLAMASTAAAGVVAFSLRELPPGAAPAPASSGAEPVELPAEPQSELPAHLASGFVEPLPALPLAPPATPPTASASERGHEPWPTAEPSPDDLLDPTAAPAAPAPAGTPPPATAVAPNADPASNVEPEPARPAPDASTIRLSVSPAPTAGAPAAAEAQRALAAGDLHGAVSLYNRALAAAPGDAVLHNDLGTAYQRLGRHQEARDAFQQALTLQPAFAAAWSNLGGALGLLGRRDEALRALAEAIRLDPSNVGAKVNLAIQYQAQGVVVEAERLLREALAAGPALPEAHYALAQLLELRRDRAGAIEQYRLFLRTAGGRFADAEAAAADRLRSLEGAR